MAEAALLIGWGPPVRGREAKGLDVFNESIEYWGRLQQDGRIESFEVVLLYPHGGDLGGFAPLRGSHDQLNEVGGDEEFLRLTTRAGRRRGRAGSADRALPAGRRRADLSTRSHRAIGAAGSGGDDRVLRSLPLRADESLEAASSHGIRTSVALTPVPC